VDDVDGERDFQLLEVEVRAAADSGRREVELAGFALAAPTKSLSVFQPVSLPVISTFGVLPSSARLVKSFSVS
jgi:hypothetical protein